jgi:hypothetical protein
MIGAYAVFALAVTIALSFVLVIHQWIDREDKLSHS